MNEANNSDEENTEIATSSQGTTREPLSTSISPRSNIASEQNRDMNNGTLLKTFSISLFPPN